MPVVLLIPVGVQLLFPARLLAWLALRQHPSRAAWALAVVFVAFGGRSHGVDLVRVDAWGRRSTRLQQGDPAAYRIFGSSVLAPSTGHVAAMTDGLPDQLVPDVDRAHLAGNHVRLGCGAVQVVLGHLQRGSVVTRVGDTVEPGALLGRVGNSGDTIHTQCAGTAAMPRGGEPLPIQLSGWYPVRNHLWTVRR